MTVSRSTPNLRIAFIDDGLLAATFWSRDGSGLHLHAAILDARTGEVKSRGSWPQPFVDGFELYGANHGKFVVRLGPRAYNIARLHMWLVLIGRDLKALQQREFEGTSGTFWTTMSSPSGETLFVFRDTLDKATISDLSARETVALHTDDLSERMRWKDWFGGLNISTSDSTMARNDIQSRHFTGNIFVANVGKGDWRFIYRANNAGVPVVLNDRTIMLGGNHVIVVTNEGQVLFSDTQFQRDEVIDGAIPSANGDRFVAVATTEKTFFLNDFPTAVKQRLLMYDVAERSRICSFEMKDRSRWLQLCCQYAALSRDGSILAYVHGTVVEALRLACN